MGTRTTLTALAIVLALAIWVESRHRVLSAWLTPDAVSAERGEGTGSEAPVMAPIEPFIAPSVTPMELLTQTVSRPLFMPTRRPPEVVASATSSLPDAPPTPTQVPQVVLTAVVITDGDRVALLRLSDSEELLRLREGQDVAGWQLTRVSEDGITLSQGGKTHEVALRTYQPAAAPAPSRSERRRRASDERRRQARQGTRSETVARPRRPRRGPRQRSGATPRGTTE